MYFRAKNVIITHYSQCTCSVQTFSDSFSPINNILVVQGATAYDCPHIGQTYILLINEGLYFGTSMNHSLINPNQLRHFGTIVQDNPYSKDNITYIEANVPDNDKRLQLPLTSKRINILFETQIPTQQELDDCPHVNLTSDS